ncbi:hypothetical protein [Lacinutrix sp. Hel_I_90]|uniref:hypothetical protein n=1 Tax=Lacinutrix sp. Hel_I_90 TaxID=1249999 RepID=UPI0005CA610C|nr:hypothetical protein [Lacinutrix sp. Hel_I_90]
MKNKTPLFILIIAVILSACSKNDDDNNQSNNPNIPRAVFDTGTSINTNLPQYNQLQFPNNNVIIDNAGINGVILHFSGNAYSAFELSDPNHPINSCTTLSVNGIIATCGCDDGNAYEVLGGAPQQGTTGQYTLVRYNVEVSGAIIRVFNN